MNILNLVDIPAYWILLALCFLLLYMYVTWNDNFFLKRGVPGPPPARLSGLFDKVFVYKLSEWEEKYGKVFGCFLGREPVFVVSDLGLLKEVFVKSFDNFRNRKKTEWAPRLFGLDLFFLEDEAWKRVRTIITPTFSSGKLRGMMGPINDCSDVLQRNFLNAVEKKENVDVKEYFGAYTMDVISQTAFGIKVDSHNFSNPFLTNAKKLFSAEMNPVVQFLTVWFPAGLKLLQRFGLPFCSPKTLDFFVCQVKEMIKQRQLESEEFKGASQSKQSDFLQLMMNAESDDTSDHVATSSSHQVLLNPGPAPDDVILQFGQGLTTDELIGQGILFFIAGYETTATTLHFASYLLATHPDVQEKAYREIVDVLGDERPTYENISKLNYLEKVILETLRLFPPLSYINRRASETITLGNTCVPKGHAVFIPIKTIQRNPTIFHRPDEFIPERHDENINPITFLAFGFGPRHCIGRRLALLGAKIALIQVLRKVRFEPGPAALQGELEVRETGVTTAIKPIILKVSARN